MELIIVDPIKDVSVGLSIRTDGDVPGFLEKLSRTPVHPGSYRKIRPDSPSEARALLSAFSESVKTSNVPGRDLLEFVAAAFYEILNGSRHDRALPGKALGLHHRQRSRPKVNEQRDWTIANDVLDLMDSGETLFSAALQLTEKYKIHESTIQNIYSKYKTIVEFNRSLSSEMGSHSH